MLETVKVRRVISVLFDMLFAPNAGYPVINGSLYGNGEVKVTIHIRLESTGYEPTY